MNTPTAPTPQWEKRRVVAALVAVQVFFGLQYLAAKIVLLEIEPRAWAFLRVVGGALVLLVLARFLGGRLPTRRSDLLKLAGLAVFGVALNQICFVEGLSRTTPTHSALINTTIPAITFLFAVLSGNERLLPARALAMLVAFAGVVLILQPWSAGGAGATLAGDLFTMVNATSYSLFLVLSRPLLRRIEPLGATTALLLFGSVWVGLVGAPAVLRMSPAQVSPEVWLLGLFIVVFPTAVAYLLSYWALQRAESSTVASFIFLQPVIAAALSALLLDERVGAAVLVGALLILGGVYGVLRPSRGPGRHPETPGSPADRTTGNAENAE